MEIIQNENLNTFQTTIDGHTAFVRYSLFGRSIIFTHTEVPEALEGGGIGSVLAKFVLDYAKENNLKVVPVCPFISSYLKRHPLY